MTTAADERAHELSSTEVSMLRQSALWKAQLVGGPEIIEARVVRPAQRNMPGTQS